jgi:hypothetical protein
MIPMPNLTALVAAGSLAIGGWGGLQWNAGEVSSLKLEIKQIEIDRQKDLLQLETKRKQTIAKMQAEIDRGYTKYVENKDATEAKSAALTNLLNRDQSAIIRLCESSVREAGDSARSVAETASERARRIEASLISIATKCDLKTEQLNALIDAVR